MARSKSGRTRGDMSFVVSENYGIADELDALARRHVFDVDKMLQRIGANER